MKSFSSLCYCGRSCLHLLFLCLGFLNTSELFFFQNLDEYFFICIYTDTEGKPQKVSALTGCPY